MNRLLPTALASLVVLGCGSGDHPSGSGSGGAGAGGPGASSTGVGAGGAGASTPFLVHEADLAYDGAFRVPPGSFGSDPNAIFDYSDDGLAFSPDPGTLFIKGHTYGQMVAEISIPAPVDATNLGALPEAQVLQPFADLTEGHLGDEMIANSIIQGGLLVDGPRLVGSYWAYYDGASEQTYSHFTSGLDLSQHGDFQGMYTVGTVFPAFVGGAMTRVPTEWQSAFGGPALTGHCCTSIISHQSWGPSAFVFDPADLGQKDPAPAAGLVHYDMDHPTLGDWNNTSTKNPSYNMSSLVTGIVFPPGTKSVLFFGRTGLGVPCYGEGTNDPSLAGQPTPDGSEYCYDPDISSKGTHAYPYAAYVWAYDADDLVGVKQGKHQPWEVVPYAEWKLALPFDTGANDLNGAVFDDAHDKLYVAQARVDEARPVVHVFTLKRP